MLGTYLILETRKTFKIHISAAEFGSQFDSSVLDSLRPVPILQDLINLAGSCRGYAEEVSWWKLLPHYPQNAKLERCSAAKDWPPLHGKFQAVSR